MSEERTWWIYLIRCHDDSLYCGITTDVSRRFTEHQSQGPKCAKYLRGRAPLVLVYRRKAKDRSEALREEYRIKQLSRSLKKSLIANADPS